MRCGIIREADGRFSSFREETFSRFDGLTINCNCAHAGASYRDSPSALCQTVETIKLYAYVCIGMMPVKRRIGNQVGNEM